MKELFVNNAKTNVSIRALKISVSEEIRSRRYSESFYKHNIMELYTWLNFFSVKYEFDIKSLLELLLENLYNEAKIDAFVYQTAQMAASNDFPSFYYIVQKIVLDQYMTSKKLDEEIRNSVLNDLVALMDTHAGKLVLSYGSWSLEFLYAKKQKVKFYRKEMITAKLVKIFNGMFFEHLRPVFVEFLRHIKARRFSHDTETNKQIEEVLTRYYLVYLKNMVVHPKKVMSKNTHPALKSG